MEQNTNLTEGNIVSTLLKFAFPFLLASLLQALYGAADLLIVGQFSDSAAVSAVAIGSQVMQTITGIVLGLTTGGTVLIGQYLGGKKEEDIAKTIGTMIYIFGIISVVLTILMILLTGTITNLMHTPIEALTFTNQYIFTCSTGIVFIVGYNVVSGILRGLGDSKSPLIFIAIACITNIIIDLILVGIFNMGALGAAIATISAQGISLVLAVLFIKKKGFKFEFNKGHLRINKEKTQKIFKLGLPIAMQDGLINISFLLITTIINSMGVIASASVGVVEKIIIFAMLVPTAFASSIAVMTAQNMGANKPKRAKQSLYLGIFFSLIFGVLACLYANLNPNSITSLFTTDQAVIETSSLFLKSYSIDCIMVCFVFCMNSFFSGCGHSLFPMIHSLIATFLVRIPVSYALSKVSGITLYEIGLAAPLATFLSLIMCIIYMKLGKWKKNTLVKESMSYDY